MLQLCNETERLAGMSAARIGGKPEDVIRAALEREAKALGVTDAPTKSNLTVAEILTFGARAARRPIVDPRRGWLERATGIHIGQVRQANSRFPHAAACVYRDFAASASQD